MKIRLNELRSIIREELASLLEALDSDIEALNKELSGAKWVGVDAGTAKDWALAVGDFQKASKSNDSNLLKAAKEKARNVLNKIIGKKESDDAAKSAPPDVAVAKELLAKLGEAEEVLDEVEESDVEESVASDTKKRREIRKAMSPSVKNPYAVYQSMVQKGYDVPPVRRKRKKKAE